MKRPRSWFRVTIILALFSVGFAILVGAAEARPGNDDFANAQAITGFSGSAGGSTSGSTLQPGEPNPFGNAAGTDWYAWSSPAGGQIRFKVGSAQRIAVFTGTAVDALTQVSDPDATPTNTAFNAQAGTTYYVQVSAPAGTTHGFTLTWDYRTSPNVVVILTDDERWDELPMMPKTQSLLVDHGMTFSQAFDSNPLCCPARATWLTGQYSHSTGVYWNRPPDGGFATFKANGDEKRTVATWLKADGYQTGIFGKYLNGYTPTRASYVPPGWKQWLGLTIENGPGGDGKGGYYNYVLSRNGAAESYGATDADYSTDVLASNAEEYIRSTDPNSPLFEFYVPRAPHAPATPPTRYATACSSIPLNRPPNYNEADVSDKPAYIQALKSWSKNLQAKRDEFYRNQCRTLQAVDDAVQGIVDALADTGRLDNTMIMFASDNGLAIGEHRWFGKVVPYEESIRVPLVIRFDRMLNGQPSVNSHLVVDADYAPTIADVAGISAPGAEGTSLVPLLNGTATTWRSAILLEHAHGNLPAYCGVRTSNGQMYVRYTTGEEEFYDLNVDPYELTNAVADPQYMTTVADLRAETTTLCQPLPPGYTP